MKNFNMYNLLRIRVKYNSYSKIVNNLTYMHTRDMTLYLFEREKQDLSND